MHYFENEKISDCIYSLYITFIDMFLSLKDNIDDNLALEVAQFTVSILKRKKTILERDDFEFIVDLFEPYYHIFDYQTALDFISILCSKWSLYSPPGTVESYKTLSNQTELGFMHVLPEDAKSQSFILSLINFNYTGTIDIIDYNYTYSFFYFILSESNFGIMFTETTEIISDDCYMPQNFLKAHDKYILNTSVSIYPAYKKKKNKCSIMLIDEDYNVTCIIGSDKKLLSIELEGFGIYKLIRKDSYAYNVLASAMILFSWIIF